MVRIKQIVGTLIAMLFVMSNIGMAFAGVINDAPHVNLMCGLQGNSTCNSGPQVFTDNGANCGWNYQYYGPTQRQLVQNCSQTNTAASVTNYGEQDMGITNNWVANRGAMETQGRCGWSACPPPQQCRYTRFGNFCYAGRTERGQPIWVHQGWHGHR